MTSLPDRQLLQLQAAALFTYDERGRMRYVNEPGGDRAPRFFLGRAGDGVLWRCRDDLPEETVSRLARLVATEPPNAGLDAEPRNLDGYLAALGMDRGSAPINAGPAYRFPDVLPAATVTRITRANLHLLRLLPWNLEETARTFERREPFMAVIEQGAAAALCHSARLTDQAAEAGVETLEPYRRRGYAAAVVAGWAQAIRDTGRIPLYSTSWDNLASQAVGRRLGLIQYGTNLSL